MPLLFLLSSKIQMSVGVCLWVGVCGCLYKCSGVRVLDSVFTGWRDRLISRKICLISRFYGMDLHISWIMERRLFPDTRKKLNEFTDSQMKKRQFSGSRIPLPLPHRLILVPIKKDCTAGFGIFTKFGQEKGIEISFFNRTRYSNKKGASSVKIFSNKIF